MVLPTILYGLEEEEQKKLLVQLGKISEECETPFRIQMITNNVDDAIENVRYAKNVSLIILAVESVKKDKYHLGLRLGQLARKINRDHYVVYIIREKAELEMLLPLCSRSAGVLVEPLEEKFCRLVFKPLFEDYHTIYGEDTSDDGQWINLKTTGKLYRVKLSDICMVQTVDKMIEFHTAKQVISVYENMSNVEKMLGDGFIRCHRSYFVNQEQIQYIDFREMNICLTNGTNVPMARSFKESMQRRFAAGKA